jgi:hypothetical protein
VGEGCRNRALANGFMRFPDGLQEVQQRVKKFSSVFIALPGPLALALLAKCKTELGRIIWNVTFL